jgi:methylenetetrahydrofolate reductase (NADPH)
VRTLREALRSEELTLTAELTLGPRDGPEAVVEQARTLAELTDAIQVPDHRHARPHLSNIAVAALLLQNGIDPIVHMNCRDRNRLALQSDVIGARAIGVTNLVLLRGSNFPEGHRPVSTSVYDMGAIDFLATAAAIREGDVFPGTAPEGAPGLYLGTIATAFNPSQEWEPQKLTSKADAGAQFIQLQVCLDSNLLRDYVGKIVQAKLTWRFQLMACIVVLPSVEAVHYFLEARPDSVIPPKFIDRIKNSPNQAAEGVAIAAEQLQAIADVPGLSGITLVTPGDPSLVTAAIRASGLRS